MSEVIHGYAIGPLDRYFFHHNYLIVVSSSRQHAVAVAPTGEMAALPMWYPGEHGASTSIDNVQPHVR